MQPRHDALPADRAAEISREIIDGYRRVAQETVDDEWGDLEACTQANARRNLTALGREEQQPR